MPRPDKKTIPILWGTLGGLAVGMINGLLGAGGGMALVPLLESLGIKGKKGHATSLSIILPLSAVSAALYLYKGWFRAEAMLAYLPSGLLGAIIGAWLLDRMHTSWLKIAFGLLLLWGGGKNLWAG